MLDHLKKLRKFNVAICSNSYNKLKEIQMLLGDKDALCLHGEMDQQHKKELSQNLNSRVENDRM